jgi:outer membrane protein TolC
MEKLKIVLIVVAMLFVKQTSYAQDSINELDGYLILAAKNNPGLKASFNEYLAALERIPQLGALPDPQATFGYFIKPMEQLGGNQAGNIQIMQMFPWFGTLKSSKDEASMRALAKYEVFNAKKSELFYQLKISWYTLMKYDRQIKLINENIEILESLEKLLLMKFETQGDYTSPNSMSAVGMSTPQTGLQDVLRMKMEILELKNSLALLNDQRETEQIKFNSLLNRNVQTDIIISDSLKTQSLPADRLAIADSILLNNPMLAMLKNESDSYYLMEEKAKKMGLPMLGVGLNYMIIDERKGNTSLMNGKDMFMPMVSVSIPIYRKKYNAMQNEARLMQEVINEQTTDLKNNLLVQYRLFIQNINDAERRIALYKEQEDLAMKTADILVSGFTASGSDYEEVLRMQQKVLDYGFKHIEAIVDYNTSVAMAEKLMNSLNY